MKKKMILTKDLEEALNIGNHVISWINLFKNFETRVYYNFVGKYSLSIIALRNLTQ